MMSQDLKTVVFIALTFLIGMLLTIVPMSQSLVWFRPEWILMLLFFWVMMTPHRVAVIGAFFVGLLADLLTGTLFGLHALLFSLTAFLWPWVYLLLCDYQQRYEIY